MTDEKNQIEEMLKLMCEEYGNMCGECESGITCANELHAKRLYEQGYRKIPKGTSLGEYIAEQLKNVNYIKTISIDGVEVDDDNTKTS